MALEQYKTQVLLLHSQQSTLDALSAGFGDRYAVHLATSGTEALNTLGATPIHIIVSAQDLPGMSGLEALREAKKRSPDTIGILLAGSDPDDGLEALVGDEQVFQVVRGPVTPDALQNLIDTATKRVRMLTIAESANDLAANVDEPAGEHIVMETSENGTTIISDGTGRIPALKSRHVHIAPHAAGRHVDVLVLTKDEDFLETIRDSSHGSHTVHHANTPAQSEAIVRDHNVGVLVTDAAMVGSNIELVTERLRKERPRLVAVVAGRRDDGELLMDLINRGQVYRFLLKPVSPGRARLAIEASVKRHLEASDSAFQSKSRGDAPAPKDGKQPATVTRVVPKSPAAADPEQPPMSAVDTAPAVADEAAKGAKEIHDDNEAERLDSAFGDSGRFTRTMTGLAATVGKTFGGGADAAAPGTDVNSGAERGRPSVFQPRLLAIGGAAVVVVAAMVWWFGVSDSPSPEAARSVPQQTPAVDEASPSVVEAEVPQPAARPAAEVEVPPPAYKQFLDEARIARDRGEVVVPPGSSAIELYVAARNIAPEVPAISTELAQVITTAIGLIESALLDQRTADAAQSLRLVQLADPNNPRLPFLEGQVAQLELRSGLDKARVSIREGRFEDAATALRTAESAVGSETPEIALLREELAGARSEQRLDEVLARASQRLGQNALISPANDSARYYYELALSTDPENAVARQGLVIVASKLVLRAREAIDTGELDVAERYLRDATALDPQGADLGASIQALNTARAARDAAALAEAERLEAERLEAERLAELERQEALAQAVAAESSSGDAPPGEGSAMGEASQAVGSLTASTASQSATRSGSPASADRESDDTGRASGSVGYVPISSLKRTNYVAPRYPRSAQRRNITGWVDISFTVNRGGNVVDVGILDSTPGDVFNEAAREAISQWRFEPSLENGTPVERLVAVRLMFNLE